MILVTGKNGYIGSRLVKFLNAEGTDVDIRNKEKLRPLIKKADIVVNCAGKKYGVSREEFFDINVDGTRNVAELCKEYGTKLIHLGSIARGNDYGDSKAESEVIVREMKGLNAVVLRLCVINEDGVGKYRYQISKLLEDIKYIIENHDFKEYKLIKFQ